MAKTPTKISDPSIETNLNAASVAAAIRAIVNFADGTSTVQKAVAKALTITNNKEDNEIMLDAFREVFKYGRATSLRAHHHQRELRRTRWAQEISQ